MMRLTKYIISNMTLLNNFLPKFMIQFYKLFLIILFII